MTPQIEKILYATDLTKNSSYAFHFAVDLARTHGAKVIILHCIGRIPPSVYVESGPIDLPEIMKKAKEEEKTHDATEIKEELQRFCQEMQSRIGTPCVDLVSEVIVKEGYPAEEILNTADAKGCDVIVMGTHGKGWLKQTFLGSVALSVLERSRKPVLVVPLPSA
jgi:nucleotide-binding universal stress UspA family protein